MSEPRSTPDIEDVVSSVRRLVSTTQSPRVKTRDLSFDKLILTPSLRVVPEVEPVAEPMVAAEVPVDAPEVAEATAAAPAEETIPEAPFIDVDTMDAAPGATLHLVEAEWEDELWTEHEIPLAEIAAEVEDAELVAAIEAEPLTDAWPEVGVMPDSWAQTEPEWAEEGPIPFIPLHHRAAAAVPVEDEAAGAEFEPSVAELPIVELPVLELPVVEEPVADVPAVETAVVEAPVEAELTDVDLPDAGVADDTAALLVASVVAAADPVEVPLEAVTAEHEPTLFDEDGSPIAILDEEALSEIVRNLIREELQGALGERITRNVRKLVRAEINRALAARAFD
jgi:hypothetical protein